MSDPEFPVDRIHDEDHTFSKAARRSTMAMASANEKTVPARYGVLARDVSNGSSAVIRAALLAGIVCTRKPANLVSTLHKMPFEML